MFNFTKLVPFRPAGRKSRRRKSKSREPTREEQILFWQDCLKTLRAFKERWDAARKAGRDDEKATKETQRAINKRGRKRRHDGCAGEPEPNDDQGKQARRRSPVRRANRGPTGVPAGENC